MSRKQLGSSRGFRPSGRGNRRDPRVERVASRHVESLEQRRMLSITPTGVTAKVPEGTLQNINVATFTDSTPSLANAYSAQIFWGDGTSSAGTVSTNSSGIYTVSGGHSFPDENAPQLVTVSVAESNGADQDTATINSTVTVSESDTLTAKPVTTTPGSEGSNSTVTATFTDAGNPGAAAAGFTGVINWGDGTSTTGVAATGSSGGPFTIAGSHAYANDGSFTVSAVLSDTAPGTVTATATGTLVVTEAAFPVTGATLTGAESATLTGVTVATFSDPGGAAKDYSATIDWGDGTTTAGVVGGAGGNFSVTGTHPYADEGNFTVSTTVVEAEANFTASGSSTATISDTDTLAPVSGVFSPFTEGTSGTLLAFFSDSNKSALSTDFSSVINWGDSTSSVGTVTGSGGTYTVSAAHAYQDEGSHFAVATITDDAPGGNSASISGTVTVAEGDVFTPVSVSPTLAPEGSATTVAAVFSDANQTNSAANFNGVINWGDGTSSSGGSVTITGGGSSNYTVTGTHVYADEGPFTATATISEPAPGTATASQSSVLTIPDADTVNGSIAPISFTEATPFSGALATFTNTGSTASPASDLTASINWGDGTSSAGTVSGTGAAYTVSGAHTYAEGTDGTETVTVSLSDGPGASVTAAGVLVVQELASTFSVTGANVTGVENAPISGKVATFTDAGSTDTASAYQATINWGDGTSSAGTLSGSAGSYTVAGGHTYSDEGSFTVTTTVVDSGAGFTSTAATSTATVSEADVLATAGSQPTLSAQEGNTLSSALAVFANTGYAANTAGDFTATISWGDGAVTTGIVSGGSGSNLTASGNHAYAEDGNFTATVTLSDDATGSASATVSNTVSVSEAKIEAAPANISDVEGNFFIHKPVASVTDFNPLAQDSAVILWGDGTSSSGVFGSVGGLTDLVYGSHAYAEQGHYTITVKISDDGSLVKTVTSFASIADGQLTVAASPIAPKHGITLSGTVATMTDADPVNTLASDYKGTISWGDGTSSVATFVRVGTGHWVIKGSHKYARAGKYTLKVTAADESSSSVSNSRLITVT